MLSSTPAPPSFATTVTSPSAFSAGGSASSAPVHVEQMLLSRICFENTTVIVSPASIVPATFGGAPFASVTLVITGRGSTLNAPSSMSTPPSGFVITTSRVFGIAAASIETVTLIWVELTKSAVCTAGLMPPPEKATVAPLWKLEPLIVIVSFAAAWSRMAGSVGGVPVSISVSVGVTSPICETS